jgi:glycosyltransferase involved in cell wall biosynthesis
MKFANVSMNKPDVSVIIPAYNEAAVIGNVVRGVFQVLERTDHSFEVLVIDDGSDDETAKVAEAAGACVIRQPYNIGNGAAVKAGIRGAQGSSIVMLDGDGQHNPADIPRLLGPLQSFDMVVGARTRDSETDFHRDLANEAYNAFASYICNRKIEDLTSGFRAVRADVVKRFVYLLPNTFSYPSTITLAIIRCGYSMKYVPIKTIRRTGRSKIRLIRDGVRFLNIILRIAIYFAPLRVFVPASAVLFLLGVGWYLYRFCLYHVFPQVSALLILTGVIIFSLGLISEQIAQLRYDRTE